MWERSEEQSVLKRHGGSGKKRGNRVMFVWLLSAFLISLG